MIWYVSHVLLTLSFTFPIVCNSTLLIVILSSFYSAIYLSRLKIRRRKKSFFSCSRLNCVKAKQNNLRINDHEKEESSPNFETIILNMREEIHDYVRRNKITTKKYNKKRLTSLKII